MNKTATMAVALLMAAGQPAAAQLDGIPVYVNPKGGTGFTLSGDYGRRVNNDSRKLTAWAARATLGISMVSIGAGVGTVVVPNADDEIQFAGTAALRVLGGALVPVAVSLQVGVGRTSTGSGLSEVTTYNIPVGVGIGLNIPTTGFLFEPWVAPRVQINRIELASESDTQSGLGFSAGVTLGFAMGLALHAALDWVDLGSTSLPSLPDLSAKPATVGVGVSYTFRLPGLGVPGV